MSARFRDIRWLAAGGMAEVVLAVERGEGGIARTVVVKRVLPHLRNEVDFLRMFAGEARLAMALRHENIVRVVATGEDGGVPFIAMEPLFGADVRQLLAEAAKLHEPIDLRAVCGIGAGAARGLQYAHTLADEAGVPLGIVHRDISPHNLFVTRAGETKILDFGIAKSTTQLTQTQSGVLKGKFRYMAPEQIRSATIDGRVDIFALGVVLWEMLTAAALWRRENDFATANAILEESVPLPSTARADIPPALEQLVMSMLAKFPSARPANAGIVAAALDAIASGLPGTQSAAGAVSASVLHFCPESLDLEAAVASDVTGARGEATEMIVRPRSDDDAHRRDLESPPSGSSAVFAPIETSTARNALVRVRRGWILAAIAAGLVAVGVLVGGLALRTDDRRHAGSATERGQHDSTRAAGEATRLVAAQQAPNGVSGLAPGAIADAAAPHVVPSIAVRRSDAPATRAVHGTTAAAARTRADAGVAVVRTGSARTVRATRILRVGSIRE